MRKVENSYQNYGNYYYKTQLRIAKQAKCKLVQQLNRLIIGEKSRIAGMAHQDCMVY